MVACHAVTQLLDLKVDFGTLHAALFEAVHERWRHTTAVAHHGIWNARLQRMIPSPTSETAFAIIAREALHSIATRRASAWKTTVDLPNPILTRAQTQVLLNYMPFTLLLREPTVAIDDTHILLFIAAEGGGVPRGSRSAAVVQS